MSINTAAVERPDLVSELSEEFGAQCVVVAIDARRCPPESDVPTKSGYEVYTHGGRTPTGTDVVWWARTVERLGAGEILLTSMDRDGTKDGFDLKLTRAVADAVNIPVIASRRRRRPPAPGRRRDRGRGRRRAGRVDLPLRRVHDRRGQGVPGRRRGGHPPGLIYARACPIGRNRGREISLLSIDIRYRVCNGAPMAIREAVLVLLAAGPKHGYQLKAEFETALIARGTLNTGQVYTTLDRLVRDGLVEETELADVDDEATDGRRKPFRVTTEGRKVAHEWLFEATPPADRSRDELVSRVLLAVHTGAADVVGVIDQQRQALVARLQDVRRQQRKVDDDLPAALVADAMASTLEADLGWLDRAEARLRRNRDTRDRDRTDNRQTTGRRTT